jgi:hypothetical protein
MAQAVRRDDPEALGALGVQDGEQPAPVGHSEDGESGFNVRVPLVGHGDRQWFGDDGRGLGNGHAVLRKVGRRLGRVPLECEGHRGTMVRPAIPRISLTPRR